MTRLYPPKRITPETLIKTQVKNWLRGEEYLGKLTWWWTLQGLGCYPGVGDIGVLKSGIYYELEIKSERGMQSEVQKTREAKVTRHGGVYKIIRDWKEAEALLK